MKAKAMPLMILGLLASTVGFGLPGSETSAPQAGNPENGRQVFDDRGCYQCHGYEAQGGPGSRLAPEPLPFLSFSSYVREPSGQIPPYTTRVLSEVEMADIYAFIESIPEPPPLDSIPALNNDQSIARLGVGDSNGSLSPGRLSATHSMTPLHSGRYVC